VDEVLGDELREAQVEAPPPGRTVVGLRLDPRQQGLDLGEGGAAVDQGHGRGSIRADRQNRKY
jgi:hypothetical protein